MTLKSYLNKQMHGDASITFDAVLAINRGSGEQQEGFSKACAGFVGFSPGDCQLSEYEYEAWECEIIIVPKVKHRDGPFKGWRLDQVIVSLRDFAKGFREHEVIKE